MRTSLLALSLMFIVGAPGRANPYVTATYQHLQLGGYQLNFVVYMDEFHGSSYEWGLSAISISDLEGPIGWNAGSDSRHTWWSTPFLSGYQIPPSGVLGGFSGTFATLPSQLNYYVSTTEGGGGVADVLVPTPIPEPSSILALAGGLTGLAGLRLRLRKKRRTRSKTLRWL